MKKTETYHDEALRIIMRQQAEETRKMEFPEDLADQLMQRIEQKEALKRTALQRKRIWLSVGIAAAILLLLVMGFWLNGKFNEKPELIVQTDSIKAAPLIEEKKVEEQPQKPVEHKEQADSVNKVKEMQRIARPPKRYMAKVEKEELSEPEIQKKTLESEVAIEYAGSTVWRADENMFQSTYEDVVREIQERGERMNKSIELAMGDDLY